MGEGRLKNQWCYGWLFLVVEFEAVGRATL